jgi:hypothetical protein
MTSGPIEVAGEALFDLVLARDGTAGVLAQCEPSLSRSA